MRYPKRLQLRTRDGGCYATCVRPHLNFPFACFLLAFCLIVPCIISTILIYRTSIKMRYFRQKQLLFFQRDQGLAQRNKLLFALNCFCKPKSTKTLLLFLG